MSDEKIQLEIDLADAPEYLDLIQKKLMLIREEIDRKRADLDTLVAKALNLGHMVERLQGVGKNTPALIVKNEVIGPSPRPRILPVNRYDASWGLWEKIQYVLRREIAPITKVQIIERLVMIEPRIKEFPPKKRRQFSVNISSVLSTKSTQGKLMRIEDQKSDNRYSLPLGETKNENEEAIIIEHA